MSFDEDLEARDDAPAWRPCGTVFADIARARLTRRGWLAGAGALALGSGAASARAAAHQNFEGAHHDRYMFDEAPAGVDARHHVAAGHRADVVVSWGDPIKSDAAPFDGWVRSAAEQLDRFGYNCDYIAHFPMGEGADDRALLCVNHEYVNPDLMFPKDADVTPAERARIMLAAHGVSVVETARGPDGRFRVDREGRFNRRITPLATRMGFSGPAAGDPRVGDRVTGTINNCAGGKTPWGTYLTAEENFYFYFSGDPPADGREASRERYRIPGGAYPLNALDPRWDVGVTPNEPNRFGWIVEIDPFDPSWVPRKHTAMGRFFHEGAETTVNKDGRVVVYSGDDARFEFLYRFVSARAWAPDMAKSEARTLLDEGELSVAVFHEDGRLEWRPLLWGEGPLTPDNGFESQADVLIDARLAATLLGATPMDRPEDVQPSAPEDAAHVYLLLTNNTAREPDARDAANPRAPNDYGHILDLSPPNRNHAAREFMWDFLVFGGDPNNPAHKAPGHPLTSAQGWFASPDNAAVDPSGRLWVATDQGRGWPKTGRADGFYGVETTGALRGRTKLFLRAPVGAEVAGPAFTPDGRTVFLSIQHPGADGTRSFPGFERDSTFEDPATRWPDFKDGWPPRPSVVALEREDGGRVAMA